MIDPPSFSLGIDEPQIPSFSLGLDDLFPPTPAATAEREADVPPTFPTQFPDFPRNAQIFPSSPGPSQAPFLNDDEDFEETTKRDLKRLRRGPAIRKPTQDVFSFPAGEDDIEEFSSEDEQPKSQKFKTRTFSALKPVRTPPAFERKGPSLDIPSSSASKVTIKKTSLGSKEVKFQDMRTPLNTIGSKTPVYEFRDNQICIDVDESDEEPDFFIRRTPGNFTRSPRDPWNINESPHSVAELLRQRFPYFSSIDDLEANGGDPVYIDYRGQFGGKRSNTKSNVKHHPQTNVKNRRVNKRRKTNSGGSSQVLQENVNNTGRKGYWLTEGGGKVYITPEGQRLFGQTAYKQYMRDNGKLGRPGRKKQKSQRRGNRKS